MQGETSAAGKNISNEDIYELLQSINSKHTNIEKRLERIENNLSKEVEDTHKKLDVLKEENKKLKLQLSDIQKRQKKYNIVIYGVTEGDTNLQQSIQDIITSKIGIPCGESEFRDVYRLGKKAINAKSRPVLVEFISYSKKLEILRNGMKLKGTGVYISNDYIQEENEERKILVTHLKQAREKNYNAKIYKNKLVINGEFYAIEDLLDGETPLAADVIIEDKEINSDRNTNSAPATPTNKIAGENIVMINENLEEERRVRTLRNNLQNTNSITKTTDRKRLNIDNKEDKDSKRKK